MKNNDIIKSADSIYRIIDIAETKVFIIDCSRKSMPKWVDKCSLSSYSLCPEELGVLSDINDLDAISRKTAYERFNIISNILPFITEKNKRCSIINQVALEKGVSKQTICKYLWLYLAYQNISALAPKLQDTERELTQDEKNIKCALNKYFYNQSKNALSTAYTLMLKEMYCDSEGHLNPFYRKDR